MHTAKVLTKTKIKCAIIITYLGKKAEQGLDVIAQDRIANQSPVFAPHALQKRLALKRRQHVATIRLPFPVKVAIVRPSI